MITRLLMASGLTVGTYTSPHLERVNERIARNSEPIADDDFAEQIAAVADLEGLIGVRPATSRRSPQRPSAGSPTSPSTSPWSRSGCSVAGTPPTSSTPRSPSSPTSAWTTTSSPARRSPTSPARRRASSSRTARRVIGETDPELVAVLVRRTGGVAPVPRRSTSTSTTTSWPSAAGSSTSARRRRSTPRCSCRCTAPTRATTRRSPSTAVETFFAAPLSAEVGRRGLRRRVSSPAASRCSSTSRW